MDEKDKTISFEDFDKQIEEDNIKLRKMAVDRASLITTVKFTVQTIKVVTFGTSISPTSEMRYGGPCKSYRGGDRCVTEIGVWSSDTGIEKVIFEGFLPLQPADNFKAYFLKGKTVSEHPSLFKGSFSNNYPFHWVERDWEEKETALRIDKFGPWDGSNSEWTLATYQVNDKDIDGVLI